MHKGLANSRCLCYHLFVSDKSRFMKRRAYHAEEQNNSNQNRETDSQRYGVPRMSQMTLLYYAIL